MTTANIIPTAGTDGITYCTSVPLTTTEAVLGDAAQVPTVIPTTIGEAISAVVVLTVTGIVTGNSTYVVLQMDMGDGVWVDLNWCFWNGNQGSATFVFSNGIAGANVFQQTRQSNGVPNPQSNGSNQMTLGGRLRFVGRTAMTGGSSSVSGTPTAVSATIKYRLLPLR